MFCPRYFLFSCFLIRNRVLLPNLLILFFHACGNYLKMCETVAAPAQGFSPTWNAESPKFKLEYSHHVVTRGSPITFALKLDQRKCSFDPVQKRHCRMAVGKASCRYSACHHYVEGMVLNSAFPSHPCFGHLRVSFLPPPIWKQPK